MRIDIVTLFPEMFGPVLEESIVGKARKKGYLQICCHQLRDFSSDPRRRVDDTVFGGGKGMLLAAEPFARCIDELSEHLGKRPHIITMSPRGKVLTQEHARELSRMEGLVILCGHYEGIDERLLQEYGAEEVSIGDYVLTGGRAARHDPGGRRKPYAARRAVGRGMLYGGKPFFRAAGVPPVHQARSLAGQGRAPGAAQRAP